MIVIGLTGSARVGKDSAAKTLTDEYGFTRLAFADTLRDMLFALDPLVGSGHRLRTLVERYGWDAAKSTPEVRRLLQVLGTEAGRNILGDDVWVNHTFARMTDPRGRYVITDVRFPNEAHAVLSFDPPCLQRDAPPMSGFLRRITRPGVGPINGHLSDNALGGLECPVIANDGTLEDLRDKVRREAEDILALAGL